MDLRLLDAEPTAAERDAVDAFLGPSLATWSGTDAIDNGHAAHGGHAARAQRHMLLPTLHALHERAGWISPGGLNYVAQRLTVPPADVYGVATFYALFSTEERPPRVVHVCDDVACRCAGSEELIAELKERFGPEDTDVDGASWLRSPCLGQCDRAPAALLTEAGDAPLERELTLVDAGGGHRRSSTAARRPSHPRPRRPSRATRACACCAASGRSIPRASTTTAPTAATTPCAARSSSAPRASSARSSTRARRAAAAPPSRWGASGTPSRASPGARTT